MKWHAQCPLIRDSPGWAPTPTLSLHKPTHGINNHHNQCYLNTAIQSLYPLHFLLLDSIIPQPNSHLLTPLKTTLQHLHQQQPPDRRSQDLATAQLLHEINTHYSTTFSIHVQNSPTDIQLLLLHTLLGQKPSNFSFCLNRRDCAINKGRPRIVGKGRLWVWQIVLMNVIYL